MAEPSKVGWAVPLVKDEARHLVYTVPLIPDLVDSQGDTISAVEIEKAAHKFMVEFRKHDTDHNEIQAGVETVESYVAPCDLTIEGMNVKKGSWVNVLHVSDPDVWDRVQKGELTGSSIGGTGVRS